MFGSDALVLVDEERDRTWTLEPPVSIGRAEDNTIVIEDPRVAPRHAVIERRDGELRLVDLGSRDGTFVGGMRVSEATLIEGDEIVVGIECFRVARATRAGERELAKLRACVAVSRCLDLELEVDRILERILLALGEVLEIDRGAVILVAPGTHEPMRRTTWSRDGQPIPPISTTMMREALASSKGVIVNDVLAEPRFSRSRSLAEQGVLSVACLPLRHGGENLGVLYVDSHRTRTPFERTDLDLLSGLAAQAALVVKNALLREHLTNRTYAAEQANRRKTDFLRNMSHELRTPLNGVVGFAELLATGAAGPLSPLQNEFLADLLGSARHLVKIIGDLLDVSAAESNRISLELDTVDLTELSTEVCKSFASVAEGAGVDVFVTTDAGIGLVRADPTRLRQVIYNFVSNALKFSSANHRVDVRVVGEGETYRIEVADTGIGIRREDLARVFHDPVQLEPGNTFPGTGLGLVLTRRIVEAHGGRVGVQSVRDQGSTFYAVLPRAAVRS